MTRLETIARRHRLGHSVLLALTVCLLVGTATVDPLLTRSFSFALVGFHADAQPMVGRQVSINSNASGAASPEDADRSTSVPLLEKHLDPRVKAVVGDPLVTRSVHGVTWLEAAKSPITVQSSAGQCRHVKLLKGRCPRGRHEVMIPRQAFRKAVTGLHLGSVATLDGAKVRIVGVFTMSTADPYWRGTNLDRFEPPSLFSATPSSTTALATPGLVTSLSPLSVTVSYPVETAELTPDRLRSAAAGARAMESRSDVVVFESLDQVDAATHNDLDQVGRIIPFLLVPLGIVLLILLVQVVSFLATVRRGEAAILKMRGNGTIGVLRFGAAEFAPWFGVGVVAGLVLAYVVDWLVRHLWLPGEVGTAWSWTSALIALGMAVLLAAVCALCWWLVARESISALLRARPPRSRGAGLSMPGAVIGALCLVGVLLTATKNLTGAPVQVAPVLLAGLVAIAVSVVFAPLTAWLVRRLLARRRTAGALAVAQLGRRAGVVTAVTTLIITSALLTLSLSVFARGADNRAARTAADLGAESLIYVTTGTAAVSGQSLIDAIDSIDPHHRVFTPSVQINAATTQSTATMGVIPKDMERIGSRHGVQHPVPWRALQVGTSDGEPAALLASWTIAGRTGSEVTAPTMGDVDGQFKVVGTAPYIPGVGDRTIAVDLATMLQQGGRRSDVSYQVFAATQDPHRLAALRTAVRKKGFAGTEVHRATQVRASYDATATAWAMNLSIVVSALSVFAALTSVVLVAVASQDSRRRDLRALRTGGVPRRVARRATVVEFVLLALAGSLVGAATAPLSAWLVGRTMLWWSSPPKQPLTQTGFQWAVGLTAAAALIVLLVLVAVAFGVRLARSAEATGKGRKA